MKRSEAARLIDKLRELAADPSTDRQNFIDALEEAGIYPLEVCTGEAHSNAFIDNCSLCAPRWGFVGKAVKVT